VRRQRPNEPALMIHTARFLAELKGVGPEDLARASSRTAENFFDLGRPTTTAR
jgi:TatD DNase family protein